MLVFPATACKEVLVRAFAVQYSDLFGGRIDAKYAAPTGVRIGSRPVDVVVEHSDETIGCEIGVVLTDKWMGQVPLHHFCLAIDYEHGVDVSQRYHDISLIE